MSTHVLRTVYTGRVRADLGEENNYLEVMKRNAKDSYLDAKPSPPLTPAAAPLPVTPIKPKPVAPTPSPAPTVSVNPLPPAPTPTVVEASAMTPHVPWTAYALTAAICLALLLLSLSDYAENFLRSLFQ